MGLPREWKVEPTPDGWVLTVDPSMATLQWSGVRRLLMLSFLLPAGIALALLRAFLAQSSAQRAWGLVGASVLSLLVLVLLLPATRRFMDSASLQSATLAKGHLSTPAGEFDDCGLSTLRTSTEGVDPNRVRLQFTSATMQAVDLIGPPGIRAADAADLIATIRQLSGLDLPARS